MCVQLAERAKISRKMNTAEVFMVGPRLINAGDCVATDLTGHTHRNKSVDNFEAIGIIRFDDVVVVGGTSTSTMAMVDATEDDHFNGTRTVQHLRLNGHR